MSLSKPVTKTCRSSHMGSDAANAVNDSDK